MFNASVRMKAHSLHAVPADSPIRSFNFEKAVQISRTASLRVWVKPEKTRCAAVIKKVVIFDTYDGRTEAP
jgi:hypothetical protein